MWDVDPFDFFFAQNQACAVRSVLVQLQLAVLSSIPRIPGGASIAAVAYLGASRRPCWLGARLRQAARVAATSCQFTALTGHHITSLCRLLPVSSPSVSSSIIRGSQHHLQHLQHHLQHQCGLTSLDYHTQCAEKR